MPKYLTVQKFHELHCKYFRVIHIKTVYRWVEEEKVAAKKDRGGHNWLVVVREEDPLFPFL